MASNSWQLGYYPFMRHHLFPSLPHTNQRRTPKPSEVIKSLYDNTSSTAGGAEDSASNTSSSGCTMDSIDSIPPSESPVRMQKKRSRHRLLREIRRLRSENDSLRNMVDTIKEDLRFERESRQISEQCHLKYYTDSSDRQTELEDDVADKQKLIDDLKHQIEDLKSQSRSSLPTLTSSYYSSSASSTSRAFACYNFDDPEMLCQPICEESAIPDGTVADCSSEEEDDYDDDEEDDGLTDNQRFEQLASSYLRQAILSKLTSARANLELDDLMLKYDPSPAVVLTTLANAFVAWLDNTIGSSKHNFTKETWKYAVVDGFVAFWKSILEKHVHDEDDMAQFLNEIERYCRRRQGDGIKEHEATNRLVENYQHFLVMLYKYDIIDAEAISAWWRAARNSSSVADRLRGVTTAFIEWLEKEEEEEDDDDDDDDDDNDDNDDQVDNSDSDTVIAHLDKDNDDESVLEDVRMYCVCQFDTPTDTPKTTPTTSPTPHTPPSAHNNNDKSSLPCKCDYLYTAPPLKADKKPKKTVRINL